MTFYLIISILIFLFGIFIGFMMSKSYHIIIHNDDDIRKGMELERTNKQFRDYLDSYYSQEIPPVGVVEEGYRKIKKEVLGHY